MTTEKERYLIIQIIVKYLAISYFRDRSLSIHWVSSPKKEFDGKTPKELILNGQGERVWDLILSEEFDRGEY